MRHQASPLPETSTPLLWWVQRRTTRQRLTWHDVVPRASDVIAGRRKPERWCTMVSPSRGGASQRRDVWRRLRPVAFRAEASSCLRGNRASSPYSLSSPRSSTHVVRSDASLIQGLGLSTERALRQAAGDVCVGITGTLRAGRQQRKRRVSADPHLRAVPPLLPHRRLPAQRATPGPPRRDPGATP